MAFNFSTTGDNITGPAITTGVPLSLYCWVKPAGVSFNNYVSQGQSGVLTDRCTLMTDFNGNKTLAALTQTSLGATEGTGGTVTAATWQCLSASWASSTSRTPYYNGTKGSTNTTSRPVAAPNQLRISGREDNGSQTAGGLMSHVAAWGRALDDSEHLFLSTGGNPRALAPLYYDRLNNSSTSRTPDIGSGTYTVTGTTFSNADMPVLGTFWVSTNLSNQVFVQNATGSVVLDGFDDVTSAYTVNLYKVGASGGSTTTTAAATSNLIPLTSVTGFVAGDYITVGSSPGTLILAVNATTILVRDAQTFASGATITHYPATLTSIPGMTITSGTLAGNPTTLQAGNTNYVARAINNTTSSLIADSNLFTITVQASSGGGSGGGAISLPPFPRKKFTYYDLYYPR